MSVGSDESRFVCVLIISTPVNSLWPDKMMFFIKIGVVLICAAVGVMATSKYTPASEWGKNLETDHKLLCSFHHIVSRFLRLRWFSSPPRSQAIAVNFAFATLLVVLVILIKAQYFVSLPIHGGNGPRPSWSPSSV